MARKKATAKSLSGQLRDAVRGCGTTRYALARQLGVSESTLSRFLSGERGLTLDLVDKLADVLGLQLVATVQRAARPTRRGPKPREEKPMVRIAPNWGELAEKAAGDAHENYFSSRRGIWHLADFDVLCLYNNNPYDKYPDLRDEETAAFRDWLKSKGIKELAYTTYPATGEEAGYTYAMLIDAGADRQDEVAGELRRILAESFERMKSDT